MVIYTYTYTYNIYVLHLVEGKAFVLRVFARGARRVADGEGAPDLLLVGVRARLRLRVRVRVRLRVRVRVRA